MICLGGPLDGTELDTFVKTGAILILRMSQSEWQCGSEVAHVWKFIDGCARASARYEARGNKLVSRDLITGWPKWND